MICNRGSYLWFVLVGRPGFGFVCAVAEGVCACVCVLWAWFGKVGDVKSKIHETQGEAFRRDTLVVIHKGKVFGIWTHTHTVVVQTTTTTHVSTFL